MVYIRFCAPEKAVTWLCNVGHMITVLCELTNNFSVCTFSLSSSFGVTFPSHDTFFSANDCHMLSFNTPAVVDS